MIAAATIDAGTPDAEGDDMRSVTLQELPIPLEDQHILERRIGGIDGALYVDGKAVVYGSDCVLKTEGEALERHPDATLVWRRVVLASRVQRAISLMGSQKITPHAAAERIGVNVAAVYRALKLRDERGVCPHCGQPLPKGPRA